MNERPVVLWADDEIELLKPAAPHDVVDAPAQVVVIRFMILLPEPLCSYRRIVLIDPPFDSLTGVVIAKLMDPYRLRPSRRSDSPVLSLQIEAVAVTALA